MRNRREAWARTISGLFLLEIQREHQPANAEPGPGFLVGWSKPGLSRAFQRFRGPRRLLLYEEGAKWRGFGGRWQVRRRVDPQGFPSLPGNFLIAQGAVLGRRPGESSF